MARITVIDNGILPCQEAFLVDAPHPRTSQHRWIQAKGVLRGGCGGVPGADSIPGVDFYERPSVRPSRDSHSSGGALTIIALNATIAAVRPLRAVSLAILIWRIISAVLSADWGPRSTCIEIRGLRGRWRPGRLAADFGHSERGVDHGRRGAAVQRPADDLRDRASRTALQYSLPARVGCSVMPVIHRRFGPSLLNSRFTSSATAQARDSPRRGVAGHIALLTHDRTQQLAGGAMAPGPRQFCMNWPPHIAAPDRNHVLITASVSCARRTGPN